MLTNHSVCTHCHNPEKGDPSPVLELILTAYRQLSIFYGEIFELVFLLELDCGKAASMLGFSVEETILIRNIAVKDTITIIRNSASGQPDKVVSAAIQKLDALLMRP